MKPWDGPQSELWQYRMSDNTRGVNAWVFCTDCGERRDAVGFPGCTNHRFATLQT